MIAQTESRLVLTCKKLRFANYLVVKILLKHNIEMASPAKKSKTDSSLPVCPYGSRCYRKNTQHFKEFDHTDPATAGTSKSSDTSASLSDSTASIDTSNLPVCKYGASCYRKNLLHFAEYSHPTAVTKKATAVDSDSGNDTDVISEDEDDKVYVISHVLIRPYKN